MTLQTSVHWFFKWYLDSQSVIFKLPQKFKKEKKQAIGNRDILEEYVIFLESCWICNFTNFLNISRLKFEVLCDIFFHVKFFYTKIIFRRAEIQAIVVHHSYFYVHCTVEEISLCPICISWSKTTLITGGVVGAGVDPPPPS